jgi:flagellar basal body rod protein FlgB
MDAFVRAAAAALLFALGGAPAQAPSPWTTLAVPTGVQPTQATSLGKLVAYSDGGTLYAWSAVTRAWASHPVRSQATLRLNNDCLLAQQPGSWIAFSAFTGTFAARTASAGAVLHNPVGAQNDAMLAFTDQGQLHVYCATDGQWRARAVQSNALVALQRNVLVLQQGTLESSNVNVVEELVSMIETQRAYEMNAKAIQSSDQMLQKLGQI